MGSDFAGEIARSHARFDLSSSYEAVDAAATALPELLDYMVHVKSICVLIKIQTGTYGGRCNRKTWRWGKMPPSGRDCA